MIKDEINKFTIRLSPNEDEQLTKIMESLGITKKSEVIRYLITHFIGDREKLKNKNDEFEKLKTNNAAIIKELNQKNENLLNKLSGLSASYKSFITLLNELPCEGSEA